MMKFTRKLLFKCSDADRFDSVWLKIGLKKLVAEKSAVA